MTEKQLDLFTRGPKHYKYLKPQPVEIQMKWNLTPFLFCALKYIARCGHKCDPEITLEKSAIRDCRKAIHYIEFEIERLKQCYNITE